MTDSDAIGLSERLRRGGRMLSVGPDLANEAATQLDALSARVIELEAEQEALVREIQRVNSQLADEMKRATRAEQERDEAYERLKPFANGSIDVSGTAVIVGYPDAEHALKAARDCVLRLASGPDKEKS